MRRKYLVIGFGVSGKGAAAFLLKRGGRVVAVDKNAAAYKDGLYRNNLKNREFEKEAAQIFASGTSDQPPGVPEDASSLGRGRCLWQGASEDQKFAAKLTQSKTDSSGYFGIPFAGSHFELLEDREDVSLEGISLAVLSPGVPPSHPLVQKAKRLGIETIGEIELAFRHLQNRCIGITGSNGKTTTVLLTAHCLSAAGKKARALGNVGAGLTHYLLDPDRDEILVIELSSFQLETVQTPCLDAAAILNIMPNHLDRHPSLEAYAEAKAGIRRCLKQGGTLYVSEQAAQQYAHLFGEGFRIYDQGMEGAPSGRSEEDLRKGLPERESILAASVFCAHFGVGEKDFQKGLDTFRKPAHRIEWVTDRKGVSYYNDSKSSNVASVQHAMALFRRPVILLVGGVDKGSSYRPWIDPFRGKVKRMIAFGQAAEKMERELASFLPFAKVQTLQEAVEMARGLAEENEIVLLSPGCSSYDQFRNFEHRGEEFKRLVMG